MKLSILLLSLLFLTGCPLATTERGSTVPGVLSIPEGLVYGKEVGVNWFEGAYKGDKVLIHHVVTYGAQNVEFQYVKK